MIARIAKTVVGPALLWACLVGSAFAGIGGMSVEGGGASDSQIHRLWEGDTVLAALTFVVAVIFFSLRRTARSAHQK